MTTVEQNNSDGWRSRVTRQGEEAVGWLAQEVIDNDAVQGAVKGVVDAGQRVFRARESVFGMLDLSSASDLQKLTRRMRSVSQRLEDVEDGVDGLSQKIGGMSKSDVAARLNGMESKLDEISKSQSGE